MISSLRGLVLQTSTDSLVIEVGGVGLKVSVPASVFENIEVGNVAFLYTHLVVREDALILYGFASEEQRTLFETLISVQGIGPKSALSILSSVSPDNLRRAVTQEQPELLDRIPGVGKKTAEKIVFSLKDKFGPSVPGAGGHLTDIDTEVLSALTALGYSVVESQGALQSIPKTAPKEIEERVRIALQYFVRP
jgi:holliday junction DNA helicase RuvA